jgi:D-alanyl-D-alanine carboxypeptidase/D-alanyl-D-alanine-endopeptidase (penicillin-binding protein 4)
VIDAASGISLLDRRSALAVSPASTAKLLVAAAILTVHKPTDRFTTRVVQGNSPGSVVLVGGGDPTLSGAAAGEESRYPGAARISDLAAQVTHNLGKAPAAAIRSVVVDGSLFTGARTAPGWDAGAAMLENVSPIVGVMMDGGRDDPASANRSAVPELAAGSALDSALSTASGQPHHADNPGARVTRGIVNQGARVLGEVHSAPVSRLVEQMLSESDNVVAEVLTRQVAVAAHRPATFAGGAAAVSETLAMIGIRVGHAMVDGSGLSVLNRVSVAALTGVLLRAADPGKPNLRPIVTGLPVAGWDGTLADRYSGLSRSGRGAVRAKTGTLDGVSAEAGLVTDSDGRQLVFAFIANGVPIGGTDQARVALDGLAATLAGCGCR